jgi:hypothetical protein
MRAARRGEVLTNQRARGLLGVGRDTAMLALRRLADSRLLERLGKRTAPGTGLPESLRRQLVCV